jgi:predicted transglutaminase-like cysteine proteinase
MFALTDERWTELRKVNADVNALPYRTDMALYGKPEFWESIDVAGAGDCEDYSLGKRNRLRALGWPDEALRLATCTDETGAGHAVLTVDTDRGTYVLDNRSPDVLPWAQVPYHWISRQAEGAGWVAIAAVTQ